MKSSVMQAITAERDALEADRDKWFRRCHDLTAELERRQQEADALRGSRDHLAAKVEHLTAERDSR
jgi:uncharacterized coiled-coil DUF342 family protein